MSGELPRTLAISWKTPIADVYQRELNSLTCLLRAWVISSKLGKTARSILARTQAILLNSLTARRALKQQSRNMASNQSQY